ncbi:peptidoglycan -binding protein [Ancylobacter mangrovi]|uniref:Peptidoglycan -binding protein n=1 Tax=Ancylobacter mangrovi TaxID=2972472 RepID=A0A9X2PPS7_9HYPH|nr:peptidoglycan -binding protein [Ancylobacter mangrovi]MCS0497578.1 peptidoglycan -binding protein [Ancylobacter mangrovi]MCS0503888.1 peptidoglycan -binding protein [Ancylobacter mangrovi]
MALGRSRRGDRHIDYWPGFVDALSTLLLVFVFLLSVFVLAQFVLTQEIGSKDDAMARLQQQIRELTDLLALERASDADSESQIGTLKASLAQLQQERDTLRDAASALATPDQIAEAENRNSELARQLGQEKDATAQAAAQIALLNQQIAALRRQIAALEEALDISEKKDKESQTRLADLGRRLNVALAQRVQELTRYRSEFFGRLSAILGNRPDIRVVGDRFVMQSEIFFDRASADLRSGAMPALDDIARTLVALEKEIPDDLPWVLRVDGHTDDRPIQTPQYPSNWELSAARAIAVVQYLAAHGVSPKHLVAAGFGEYQPIDTADTDDARARNRRIELKLTER